jgi:flagellar hook assembly protein FlgD
MAFGLLQNYPNPFNATTTLSYTLSQSGRANISIYNLLGQRVATIYEGEKQAGQHTITWHATGFPTGVYFARLEAGGRTENVKMVLLK